MACEAGGASLSVERSSLAIAGKDLEAPTAGLGITPAVLHHHRQPPPRTLDGDSRCRDLLRLEQIVDEHSAIREHNGAIPFQALFVGVEMVQPPVRREGGILRPDERALDVRPSAVL